MLCIGHLPFSQDGTNGMKWQELSFRITRWPACKHAGMFSIIGPQISRGVRAAPPNAKAASGGLAPSHRSAWGDMTQNTLKRVAPVNKKLLTISMDGLHACMQI
jgi:hypothetical protein